MNDLLMNAMRFFERRLEGRIAKIEQSRVGRSYEAIKAISNRVRSFGRTRSAIVAANAFILRAAEQNNIRPQEVFG